MGQSMLLGGARVSQLRVRGGACATPSAFMMPHNATCYPPFSSAASDGRPFGLGDHLFSADGDATAVGAMSQVSRRTSRATRERAARDV